MELLQSSNWPSSFQGALRLGFTEGLHVHVCMCAHNVYAHTHIHKYTLKFLKAI